MTSGPVRVRWWRSNETGDRWAFADRAGRNPRRRGRFLGRLHCERSPQAHRCPAERVYGVFLPHWWAWPRLTNSGMLAPDEAGIVEQAEAMIRRITAPDYCPPPVFSGAPFVIR